jgi:hypothetical protein
MQNAEMLNAGINYQLSIINYFTLERIGRRRDQASLP